jgi:hypothetical protein
VADTLQYMQFALGVYAASNENRLDYQYRTDWVPDLTSGFSAGCYVVGDEMIISFTGTNDNADRANWAIGTGAAMPQVFDAIDYYFKCRAEHPEITNISFTGHSLGGGLASLMAVYFDKKAVVFDEAPFQIAAIDPLFTSEVGLYMKTKGYSDIQRLAQRLDAASLPCKCCRALGIELPCVDT